MGSKRLKAVVLQGLKPIACADPEEMKRLSAGYARKVRLINLPGLVTGSVLPMTGKMLGMKTVIPMDGLMSVAILKKWGTVYNNTTGITSGDSPIKNWGGSIKDFGHKKYKRLNADHMVRRETQKYHCYSCILGCGGILDTKGITQGSHSHKPEYETACVFGALILSNDLDTIYKCNDICNRSGLDTIAAGGTIAFAVECFENGILTKEDTGGLELRWGSTDAIVKLLEMMARREGLGDILADGSKKAAERIGKGSERYAIHVGGAEPGMHDSRYDPMMGVVFAADPTPGRHTTMAGQYYNFMHLWDKDSRAPAVTRPYAKSEEYIPSEKDAKKAAMGVGFKQVVDAIGGCLFAILTGVQHWPAFEYLNAATGWKRTPEEYIDIGMRLQALRQLFSLRHGVDPRRNVLPPRMSGHPPLTEGTLAGATVPIDEMVSLYWKANGWDEKTGVPGRDIVEKLGLAAVEER